MGSLEVPDNDRNGLVLPEPCKAAFYTQASCWNWIFNATCAGESINEKEADG